MGCRFHAHEFLVACPMITILELTLASRTGLGPRGRYSSQMVHDRIWDKRLPNSLDAISRKSPI